MRDKKTKSINAAIEETTRRRIKQEEYNLKHGITPTTIRKSITSPNEENNSKYNDLSVKELHKLIETTRRKMLVSAENFEFEDAIKYRTELKILELSLLKN